jgi:3-isopropylmalate/(R)-2-methylmalate dehydratase small subunit
MQIKGRAWTFGPNINTDLIFPKPFFRASYEPGEMGRHAMAGLSSDFAAKVRPGDVIVAGPNFGCGSSREEAARSLKEAGIAALLAPSFSRLFTRNSINFGLPAFSVPGIDQEVREGDEIEIDMSLGLLFNRRSGFEAELPPIAPELLRLIEDGGLMAYTQRVLRERREAALRASPT